MGDIRQWGTEWVPVARVVLPALLLSLLSLTYTWTFGVQLEPYFAPALAWEVLVLDRQRFVVEAS